MPCFVLFSGHDSKKSPHSLVETSKTFEAFVKLSSSQRQAIVRLPKALVLECFPEGIEREDFVDSRKEVSTEGEVAKGKKARGRKVSKQSDTAKMGRSECFLFNENYHAFDGFFDICCAFCSST